MYGFVLHDIALIYQYCECTNGPTKLISLENPDWTLVQVLHQYLLGSEMHVLELFQALFLLKRERWTEVRCCWFCFVSFRFVLFHFVFFSGNFTDRIICNPVFWKELVHAQQFKSSLVLSQTTVLLSAHSPLLSPLPVLWGLPSPVGIIWVPAAVALWIPSPDPFSSVEGEISLEMTKSWPEKMCRCNS